MFKAIITKRITLAILVFFAWFTVGGAYPVTPARDKTGDKLELGKERYDVGDYETSIELLRQYAADPATPRQKQAQAYYYLAKNYNAVDPAKVKEFLLKALDTDWFLTVEEKDEYFKAIAGEARGEFMDNLPVETYLERAEAAFERGKYEESEYRYRVIMVKFPARTFDSQVKKCRDARTARQDALALYQGGQYEKAYGALNACLQVSPRDEEIKTAAAWIKTNKIAPMLEVGDRFYNDKNYREAVPFFEKVLAYLPGDEAVLQKINRCREHLQGDKTIAREGLKPRKKKKKFPLLPVILGGAAAAVVLYFIFKKKKDPPPSVGSIKVESTPTGAHVWLDGVDRQAVTPTVLADVQPGSHTVKLVKEGYLDYQVVVTVEAGKETLLFAALTQAPTPVFVTNTDTVNVPEGGSGTFQVKLSEGPLDDVTASVAWLSGDSDLSVVSGASLTFTPGNWDTYQAVTLGAAEDEDAENGQAIFRISAGGIPDKDIAAVELDSGGSGTLMVSPEAGFTAVGVEGGPFSPTGQTYILQNIGGGGIDWTVSNAVDWITLSGAGGALPGGSSVTVNVSINANAESLTVGTYTDTILFINNTNGKGSATRTVTLQISASTDSPPSVSITGPTNGETVNGTVNIDVEARDDLGIAKVEIYIDDVLVAALTASPYTFQWDTTTVSSGSHTITVRAYDTSGQTAEDEISVSVNNT
jgi:tetratricopeptide (TPR) repeat protein